MHPDYDVVIGLEVHVHLATQAKLFSRCPVAYGGEPNTSVSEICLALPGTLPVISAEAVRCAVRAGLATHCEVHSCSVFARKHYFYPDLPKGYQISQFEEPLATGGYVEIEDPAAPESTRRIRLTRIHMEEDAGKSIHDSALAGSDATLIDLNRAGVPLIEIVSEPDLASPEEAAAYLRSLHRTLRYASVSVADMERGQFRCDANVSLRPHGDTTLGTRTEIKNLNSFRSVEFALHAEIRRQADVLDSGGSVVQATMGYDVDRDRTFVMRTKENSDDYRYFPDPDLIPLQLPEAMIEEIRASLPELPAERRARFASQYGLSDYDAGVLTNARVLAELFEDTLRALPDGAPLEKRAKTVANWLARDVLAALRDRELEVEESRLSPEALAELIDLVESGALTAKNARELVPELVTSGGSPKALVRERGLGAVSDSATLEPIIDGVLAEHPEAIASFHEGEAKSLNFLMGQVMRKTGGKANAAEVRALLLSKLESS
ncbi:MAG: Asp-tRNA(Asn)/Glu-tRNA(Gln) amidotransferase subunit GatB [Myxococcales bacterium]|nr:Asp-tRNA(Asn)/Glu-tRNA(Gln) amidotransferase subunit GatB [Myxococcales bacterium]